MKIINRILWIALVSIAFLYANEPNCNGISLGKNAYNQGNFERAIDEWRTCADNGIENSDLYYNLGNAYFRNGNLGFAIYYYKSALRLSPNNSDILHNLKYATSFTKDKVQEDEDENPLLSMLFKIHHEISLKNQMFIILILFWAIAFALIFRRLSPNAKLKNVFACTAFAFVALGTFIAMSAGYKIYVAETEIQGVVTAKDADVTSAPNDKAQTLNTLSEGTSFEVLNIEGNFAQIRLGEKINGFVKLKDVGIVK